MTMTTEQATNYVKGLYIKVSAGRITQGDAQSLIKGLELTREQLKQVAPLVQPMTTRQATAKQLAQRDRATFIENRFRAVSNLGGGWYAFSPTGHRNYNRNDEIKLHGFKALEQELTEYGFFSLVGKHGYTGAMPDANLSD